MERIKADLSQKRVGVLALETAIADGNLYNLVNDLPYKDQIDVLFITGVEKSLEPYI